MRPKLFNTITGHLRLQYKTIDVNIVYILCTGKQMYWYSL